MRRRTAWTVALALGGSAAAAAAQARVWTFDDGAPGAPPAGFDLVSNRGDLPGRWVVEADGEGRALAQLDTDETSGRFAMAIAQGATCTDLRLSVRGKPVAGEIDQAVGLVWRWQDANNYYVARTNVLERNVRLYRVVNGERTRFAGAEDVELKTGEWHTLKVEHVGARVRVSLGERELFQGEDATFTGPGRVGVWIKADSVTRFDDLTLEPLD